MARTRSPSKAFASSRSGHDLPELSVPLRLHQGSGQAYINVNGQRVYLGLFERPETMIRYQRFLAEYNATRSIPLNGSGLVVRELVAAFHKHALRYYTRRNGRRGGEPENYAHAATPLLELYADVLVQRFGPKSLVTVRDRMVKAKLARAVINRRVGRIKAIFRWGVEQELVPPSVHQGLMAVAGLRRGHTSAEETQPVRAVPMARVEAIQPFVSRQVWAIIRLLVLTGARPGEILGLRPCDIEREKSVWTCTPKDHKTAHLGRQRTIYFGPQAQGVITAFLGRPEDRPLFSPAEAEHERRAALHEIRKTPLSCGNLPGSNRRREPKHQPGPVYDVVALRQAIIRGCDRAFEPPPPLGRMKGETLNTHTRRLGVEEREELSAWRTVHRWHPYQLRHTAATLIRRQFGLEAAQLALGHSSALVTEAVYAERDHEKVELVMLKCG